MPISTLFYYFFDIGRFHGNYGFQEQFGRTLPLTSNMAHGMTKFQVPYSGKPNTDAFLFRFTTLHNKVTQTRNLKRCQLTSQSLPSFPFSHHHNTHPQTRQISKQPNLCCSTLILSNCSNHADYSTFVAVLCNNHLVYFVGHCFIRMHLL